MRRGGTALWAPAAALCARYAMCALLAAAPAAARAGVRPAYGGEVRVLLPAVPRELDPARAVEPADRFAARALHATPLELDASGALAPGLLAEVPAPEAGGRAFRLRLLPGLRFADGTPLGAADVAASLARLLSRDAPSPHAWVALPILGADALLDGRAAGLAGVQVLSDRELLVTLAFPLPEWPFALAALPAAVVSPRGVGAGPFQAVTHDATALRLAANPACARGRPFADALVLAAADARGAARALERGEADLVVRPEAAAPGAPAAAPLLVTAAVVGARLGPAAEPVRRALAGLDRAELARLFARGPAEPLAAPWPSAALPGAAAPPPEEAAAPGPLPQRLALLVPAGAPDARAVADRIQVKLFDRGVRVAVEPEPPARLAARLAAGDYDAALVSIPALGLRPALAAAQLALAARGPAAALRVMAELAGLAPDAAPAAGARAARALGLVPLLASGVRVAAAPALQGAAPRPDGAFDPGDLWRLRGGAPTGAGDPAAPRRAGGER